MRDFEIIIDSWIIKRLHGILRNENKHKINESDQGEIYEYRTLGFKYK